MYKERDFSDRRHIVLQGNALQYLLDRNRDRLMQMGNELRRKVRQNACKHCNSYNGCSACACNNS